MLSETDQKNLKGNRMLLDNYLQGLLPEKED